MAVSFFEVLAAYKIDLEIAVDVWRKLRLAKVDTSQLIWLCTSQRFLNGLRELVVELAKETHRPAPERRRWLQNGPSVAQGLLLPRGPRAFLNQGGLEGLHLLAAWIHVGGSGMELALIASDPQLLERLVFLVNYLP